MRGEFVIFLRSGVPSWQAAHVCSVVLVGLRKLVKLAICLCVVMYSAMFRSVLYACLHALMHLHVHVLAHMLTHLLMDLLAYAFMYFMDCLVT